MYSLHGGVQDVFWVNLNRRAWPLTALILNIEDLLQRLDVIAKSMDKGGEGFLIIAHLHDRANEVQTFDVRRFPIALHRRYFVSDGKRWSAGVLEYGIIEAKARADDHTINGNIDHLA